MNTFFPFLTSLFASLFLSDLQGAVEEVLPILKQQGIRVFILSEHCDVDGIESLLDKIKQASDQPLSPQLRANVKIKSLALYIYTSGTTGIIFTLTSNHSLGGTGLDQHGGQ